MGEEWYPRRCKMVVQALETALLIHVDPDTHQPWRKAPYFPKLVALAGQLMAHGRMVIVLEKGHSILLLPDRMVDLGHLDAEDQIGLRQVSTATGRQWVARLVKRGREWLSSPVTYGKMPDTISPLPND